MGTPGEAAGAPKKRRLFLFTASGWLAHLRPLAGPQTRFRGRTTTCRFVHMNVRPEACQGLGFFGDDHNTFAGRYPECLALFREAMKGMLAESRRPTKEEQEHKPCGTMFSSYGDNAYWQARILRDCPEEMEFIEAVIKDDPECLAMFREAMKSERGGDHTTEQGKQQAKRTNSTDCKTITGTTRASSLKLSLRNGILYWRDQLIDGRNRYVACKMAGIEPDGWELDDDQDPIAHIVSENIHRRNLTPSQRAAIAAGEFAARHEST